MHPFETQGPGRSAVAGLVLVALPFIGHGRAVATDGPTSAAAQQHAVWSNLLPERLLGLLNLSDVIEQPCGPDLPRTAQLHAGPNDDSPAIGTLRYDVTERQPSGQSCGLTRLVLRLGDGTDEDMLTEESGYEVQALVVIERAGPWYRVARSKGTAWIRRDSAKDYTPYERLVTDGLSFLRMDWDGRLWAAPGVPGSTSLPASWTKRSGNETPVDVIGHRRLAGALWLQVRLRAESCGESLAGGPAPPAGWVRAYSATGAPTVWFWSRGC